MMSHNHYEEDDDVPSLNLTAKISQDNQSTRHSNDWQSMLADEEREYYRPNPAIALTQESLSPHLRGDIVSEYPYSSPVSPARGRKRVDVDLPPQPLRAAHTLNGASPRSGRSNVRRRSLAHTSDPILVNNGSSSLLHGGGKKDSYYALGQAPPSVSWDHNSIQQQQQQQQVKPIACNRAGCRGASRRSVVIDSNAPHFDFQDEEEILGRARRCLFQSLAKTTQSLEETQHAVTRQMLLEEMRKLLEVLKAFPNYAAGSLSPSSHHQQQQRE